MDATQRLQGIFPPITTPFDEQGRFWKEKLESNLERWNATALSGYVVLGSNGEACLLDEEEKQQVIETARRRIPASKTMIVGVGMESTKATAELARVAGGLGADVLLVGVPHYYKDRMTDDALFAHFTQVAEASPVPILLYSVPKFTGVPLTPGLVARLAEHPNIAGMKYSTSDVSVVGEIVRLSPSGFRVFIGTAPVILPAVTVGVVGAIVAVACALPESTIRLFEESRSNAVTAARRLQNTVTPPAVAVTSRFGIAGLKAAMDLCGYYGGSPRSPLLPLTAAEQATLSEVFESFRVHTVTAGSVP